MKHNADVLKAGSISVVIPAIGLLMGLGIPGILILDYVHVLLAAIWTGTDAFLGFIFYIVISGMDDDIRYHIGKRLLPMTMFFIPAVSGSKRGNIFYGSIFHGYLDPIGSTDYLELRSYSSQCVFHIWS